MSLFFTRKVTKRSDRSNAPREQTGLAQIQLLNLEECFSWEVFGVAFLILFFISKLLLHAERDNATATEVSEGRKRGVVVGWKVCC